MVDKYEIIDVHCHLFKGLAQLFPALLQKENNNTTVSLLDRSCFPFSMDLFNLDKISYTEYQTKLLSGNGIKTRIKLFTGALVLNYGSYFTEEWANSLGEWVTGEKSIGNMVLD